MATSKVGRREASAQSEAVPQSAKVAALQKRGQELTAVLGETVAILMRDPRFRHVTLNDLEWAVVPALLTNQFMMMRGMVRPKFEGEDSTGDGPGDGLTVPVGLALWASVSDEVSEKLAKQKADGVSYRLAPQEWNSGNNVWLLALVGPEKLRPALQRQIEQETLKERTVRLFG